MTPLWNQFLVSDIAAISKGYYLPDIGIKTWEEISPEQIRFFSDRDPTELIEQLHGIGFDKIEVSELKETNWSVMSPDLLHGQALGSVTVQPLVSAADLPANLDSDTIYIIPGMGFGTGHHPTTAMAVEIIQRLSTEHKEILDLGTGSGILAIAANRRYRVRIDAIDNDPYAIENAKENVEINRADVNLMVGTIESAQPKYTLLIANLYAELLISLAEEITQRVQINGEIILTGIMESLLSDVLDRYQLLGWKVVYREDRNGWSALHLNR